MLRKSILRRNHLWSSTRVILSIHKKSKCGMNIWPRMESITYFSQPCSKSRPINSTTTFLKLLSSPMRMIPSTSSSTAHKFYLLLNLYSSWNSILKSLTRKRLKSVWLDIQMLVNPVLSTQFSGKRKSQWPVCQERQNTSKLCLWPMLWLFVIARVWFFPEFQAHRLKWYWMDSTQSTLSRTIQKLCKY